MSFGSGGLPVMCISITTELLCLYIGSSNRQIMIDRLTQVNNRQNLSRFLSNKLRSHTGELFLLMIDVDYFKSINDNFGHLEGDEALIRVANALKQGCTSCRKRPYIARYGGDEFIIITELSEEETLELCSSIKNKLKELNDNAGVRYSLNLSIGCAEWKSGMTANDYIDRQTIIECKALLSSTELSIQRISSMMNFPSYSVFGKFFKRMTGMTPTEYREMTK
jgi:diguanylate cyclase (GGDEF)-like protein